METKSTKNLKTLIAMFDTQLLTVLKDDLSRQNRKMKAKFIHLATRSYDSELLSIIKADLNKIKGAVVTIDNNLVQAV